MNTANLDANFGREVLHKLLGKVMRGAGRNNKFFLKNEFYILTTCKNRGTIRINPKQYPQKR